MNETNLYHPLIISRNKLPLFFQKETIGDLIKAYNPVCGDEFTISLIWNDDGTAQLRFHGYGCAVSKAAIDMLIERLQDLDAALMIAEIERFIEVIDLLNPPPSEEYPLAVFQKVKYHPARKDCAVLGANSLLSFLNERKKCLK